MLREGDGEKLEHIAEEDRHAAPVVRQRVSRLRRHFRERWALQLASVLGVLLVVGLGFWLAHRTESLVIVPEDAGVESDVLRAKRLRADALAACAKERWQPCIELLDEARRLDPAGDVHPEVQGARARAREASTPAPSALRPLPPEPSNKMWPVPPSPRSKPTSLPPAEEPKKSVSSEAPQPQTKTAPTKSEAVDVDNVFSDGPTKDSKKRRSKGSK